jgi:hypothetical protein
MESRMKAKAVSAGIPRREFLRISSAAAMGLAVVAASEVKLFAATSSGVVPLMGVGYAPSLPGTGFSIPLASADSILSPDPRFISTGARIAAVGAKRAAGQKNVAGGIAVDALFPVSHRQDSDPLRFRFFSIAGRPDQDSISGPLSYTVQVPSTSGVSLVVRRQRPAAETTSNTPPALETEVTPLTLSLGNVAGPKLTRGVYVLAFREEAADTMSSNWNRFSLASGDAGYYVSGATFSYLILNVDYAEASTPPPNRRHAAH